MSQPPSQPPSQDPSSHPVRPPTGQPYPAPPPGQPYPAPPPGQPYGAAPPQSQPYDVSSGEPGGQPPVRQNRRPFARSFAAAGGVFVALALILVLVGSPDSAEGAGRIVGRPVAPAVIAALGVGFTARRSRTYWSWARYIGLVALITVVLLLMSTAGNLSR